MKRGVAYLLSKQDVDEIFIAYSLELLKARAAGMSVEEASKVVAARTLAIIQELSEVE